MSLDALPDVIAITLVLAATYALVALGWVFVFRATGILNFATGQILALGGFFFYSASHDWGLPFFPALVAALVLSGVLGGAIYLGLLRPLAGQPLFSPIIVTMGLAVLLTSVMSMIWGTQTRVLDPPMKDKIYHPLSGVLLSTFGIITLVAALATVIGIMALLKYSRIGLQMRATAENALLASQRGINIRLIFTVAFSVSAIVVGIAGVAYGHSSVLSPAIVALGLRGIAPALIGGMDSVGGTLVGALIVASVESVAVTQFGGEIKDAAVFVVLLLALAFRPYGLFGTPEIRRV